MKTLTLQEILEYAIRVEEESVRFYRSAGTVLVDVSIDQGGCFETSRVTTRRPGFRITTSFSARYVLSSLPLQVERNSKYVNGLIDSFEADIPGHEPHIFIKVFQWLKALV